MTYSHCYDAAAITQAEQRAHVVMEPQAYVIRQLVVDCWCRQRRRRLPAHPHGAGVQRLRYDVSRWPYDVVLWWRDDLHSVDAAVVTTVKRICENMSYLLTYFERRGQHTCACTRFRTYTIIGSIEPHEY